MNIRVIIDEASFRQADEFLRRSPQALRRTIVPAALRSAARVAARRARALAPDSKKTGSRDRWSAKTRRMRATTKQHKKTIGISTVRKYGQIIAAYAGPIHPAGNLINAIGHDHKQMLWGRPSGKTIKANRYVIEAGEQTKRQQQAVFEARVKAGILRETLKK